MTTTPEKDRCPGCPGPAIGGCGAAGGSCVAADWLRLGGEAELTRRRRVLLEEIGQLGIEGLAVQTLNLLSGAFVNLDYPLPGGGTARLLRDDRVYWGCQVERPGCERCCGLVADDGFVLVCEYGCGGRDPELLLYKKRG